MDAPQVPVLGEGGGDDGKQVCDYIELGVFYYFSQLFAVYSDLNIFDDSLVVSNTCLLNGLKGPKPQEGYRSEAYSFDSSALERAAKAAKDLEKSKFASQALDLSKQQEVSEVRFQYLSAIVNSSCHNAQ